MPRRSSKKQVASEPPPQKRVINVQAEKDFFKYSSLVGVHTTLLLFVAFFLPRTQLLQALFEPSNVPATSQDRPQHPFLDNLTANPTLTVATIFVGSYVVQAWWAGFLRKSWWMRFVEGGDQDEKTAQRVTLLSSQLKAFAVAGVSTAMASVVLFAVIILMGAPLTSHLPQTVALASLLSILAFFPAAYTLGPPPTPLSFINRLSPKTDIASIRFTWIRLFGELRPRTLEERAMLYPAVGTLAGAFIGSIPMALDWDRPWQAYPLPPAYGGVFGFVALSIWALTETGIREIYRMQTELESSSKER